MALSLLVLLVSTPVYASNKCVILGARFTDLEGHVYSPPLPGSRQYLVWVNISCSEPVTGMVIVEAHRYNLATNTVIIDENMAINIFRVHINGSASFAGLWWPHAKGTYLLRVYIWNGLPGKGMHWESYAEPFTLKIEVYNGTSNPCIDYCVAGATSLASHLGSSIKRSAENMSASIEAAVSLLDQSLSAHCSDISSAQSLYLYTVLAAIATSTTILAILLAKTRVRPRS